MAFRKLKFTEGDRVGHCKHMVTVGKVAPWQGTVMLTNPIAEHPIRVQWDHGDNKWHKEADLFKI